MGSSSSSNSVKNINLEQNSDNSSAKNKTKQLNKKGKKNDSDATESEEAAKTPTTTPPPHTEIAELTRQLCESESQRLDLEDRIQSLEENLEYLNAQNLLKADQPCDETLHAKDQYITKLEKEKTDLQTDLNKMRLKHKKKLKQFNSQTAEYKQETNFQIMELNEEIQKLKQDKKLLQASGEAKSKVSSQYEEDTPKLPGGEKMKLILELSEQVTEQEDKISKLEKKLKEKDLTIDELRVKLKNNTEYLKAIDEKKDTARSGAGDRNNSHVVGAAGRTVDNDRFKSSFKPSPVKSPNFVRPAVQDTEVDQFDESAGMKKLTTLLQGVKAKNEVGRLSIDSIDEHQEAGASRGFSIVEERVGSGRDSGLGSAGKREEEAKANTAKASNNLDWNSLESGLSDSDAEGNGFIQSKIFSAPPKLQGGKNSRLKKKTGSLKKRSSQRVEDRPPKPGLAFVSRAESPAEEKNDLWDGHPLSPIMSPVQVS